MCAWQYTWFCLCTMFAFFSVVYLRILNHFWIHQTLHPGKIFLAVHMFGQTPITPVVGSKALNSPRCDHASWASYSNYIRLKLHLQKLPASEVVWLPEMIQSR